MRPNEREGSWRARPALAILLQVAIVGVPVAVGSLWAGLLARALQGWSPRWLAMVIVVVVAVGLSVLLSRLTNRLMPLAMLLRMTMIFPDRAPSRLKVARRTTSMSDIKLRLASADLGEQEAAATMLALVTALSRHDRHTRGHSERVRLFCDLLSRELGLSAGDAGRLRWAALIHDIGKLDIPSAVLNKPGQLSSREWDLIRMHPDAGARLAAPLHDWLGPWFAGIAEHHERYDGTGYPRGLTAAAISPAGRAIAVVDAFETMTAARSYKAARSTLSARAELAECSGSHFDPAVVRAFLSIALPRLLWSVGPLALLVNLPYLRAVGEGGLRLGGVVGTSTVGAANAASVTAVALVIGASSSPSLPAPVPHPARSTAAMQVHHTVERRTAARTTTPSRPSPTTPTVHTKPAAPAGPASHEKVKVRPAGKHPASTKPENQPTSAKPAKPAKSSTSTKAGKPAKRRHSWPVWLRIWERHHRHSGTHHHRHGSTGPGHQG
jgi:hypothetical protein